MKFSFEFLYSLGPTHARKIETEMILAAFGHQRRYAKRLTIPPPDVDRNQSKRRRRRTFCLVAAVNSWSYQPLLRAVRESAVAILAALLRHQTYTACQRHLATTA